MIAKTIKFLTTDIWNIRLENIPGARSFIFRHLRIIVLSLRCFNEKKCTQKASALTFYTLMSIVPIMAMLFAIAKGFGLEATLEQRMMGSMQGHEEVVTRLFNFAHSMIENTKGGLMAGAGVAILLWTVIKMLGNIEESFNDIWGIRKSRSIGRKFSDYLSAMLICPILLITAGSLTVAITTQVTLIVEKLSLLKVLSPLIFTGLKILPFCVIWVLFSFLYVFMPNTRISVRSGIFAGIIAGTLFQLIQWVYIKFQINISSYNAIYGGFAALPLFLIWLQTSWTIVLLGAGVSYAHQNVRMYEFEPACLGASHAFKRLLALRTVQVIVRNFQDNKDPLNAEDLAQVIEIPIILLRVILSDLVSCSIINEVKTKDDRKTAYQPALNIEDLTIKAVIDALERHGADNVPVAASPELAEIERRLESFSSLLAGSPENACMKDI